MNNLSAHGSDTFRSGTGKGPEKRFVYGTKRSRAVDEATSGLAQEAEDGGLGAVLIQWAEVAADNQFLLKLRVGDLIPHFQVKATYAQKGQPRQLKVKIMYSALAVSPFADESIIAAVNRARVQIQGVGSKEPIRPLATSVQKFRQAMHKAITHAGGNRFRGSHHPAPSSVHVRASYAPARCKIRCSARG
eukprot:6638810-Pyramimonas_sp.AAC.1